MWTQRLAFATLLCAGCSDGCAVTRDRKLQELGSVADAPAHKPDATALRFTAQPRPDLAGYKSWRVRGNRNASDTRHTAALVPMVPLGWSMDAAVPLWIRIDASAGGLQEPPIDANIEALVAAAAAGPIDVDISQHLQATVDMDGTNAFQIGAHGAMQEHGLRSPTGAPLCSWPLSQGPLRLAD